MVGATASAQVQRPAIDLGAPGGKANPFQRSLSPDLQASQRDLRSTAIPVPPNSVAAPTASPTRHTTHLPLWFEENRGQEKAGVLFVSPGAGHRLVIRKDSAELTFAPAGRIRITPTAASPNAAVAPRDLLAGRSNYLIGQDRGMWKTGIRQYRSIERKAVWPGIDQIYYGGEQGLEYDFILQPGSDPSRIGLAFEGGGAPSMNSSGDLVIRAGDIELRQRRPVAYQMTGARRREIPVSYRLEAGNILRFEVGPYDRTAKLVIDPVLSYSTFVAGGADNRGYAIAVDSTGSAYLTGTTLASDFPLHGALQAINGGGYDVFVAKLNPSGTALVYATYLGGTGEDIGYGIALASGGEAVVAGSTQSINFPVASAYRPASAGGADAFVLRLNAAGSALVFSTYVGGSGDDVARGVAVSGQTTCAAGTTQSANFPTLNAWRGFYGGGGDAFVTCFSGSSLLSSTYIGGSGSDTGMGVALDNAGQVYVTGYTTSGDYPAVNALQSVLSGPDDGFVVRLSAAGGQPGYATLLGGNSYEEAHAIAVDQTGAAYITGFTYSNNFPTTPGAFNRTYSYDTDGFVTKINPAGTAIVYSTYLGGAGADGPWAIAVDKIGNAYITGSTNSPDFPVRDPIQAAVIGGAERMFKTTNGTTWTSTSGPFAIQGVPGIAIDPANASHLIAIALWDKLYQSTNGGTSWTPLLTGFPGQTSCAEAIIISPVNSNYIYLGTCNDGIYSSQNGGATWAAMGGTSAGNTILGFATDSTGLVYAAGSNGGLYKARTTDSSWTAIPTNLTANINAVAVDPTNPLNIYLATDVGVYRSLNGGVFNPSNNGMQGQGVQSLVFRPGAPTTVFAGSLCGGVYKSIDSGSNWSLSYPACVQTLAFLGNTLFAGTVTPGVFSSPDYGATWSNAGNLLSASLTLAAGGGTLYGGFQPGQDSFVSKLNAAGSALVYSTYFGGAAEFEEAHGIAVDAAGASAYITGWTGNTPPPILPTTAGALQTTFPGWNGAFSARFTDTSCVYTVSASSISAGATGGLGSITVTTTTGCQWLASAAPAWLILNGGNTGSGNPGSGSTTVSYTILPNTTPSVRSATFWIAGQAVSITQAAGASCSYAFASASTSPPAGGSAGSVVMNTGAGCPWTANPSAAWLTLSGPTGANGPGVVNFTAAPNNTLGQRIGTITAAGQTFTVTQAAAVCTFALSSSSAPISADGGSTTVTVTAAPATCTWNASVASGGSWLTITENPSLVDPRKVVFSAAPNAGAPRSGALLVASQTFTINQGGTGAPVYFTWTHQNTATPIIDNDAQLIDINGDGYPEMVFTQLYSPEGTPSPVLVYKNNGNLTFTDATATLLPSGTAVTHPRRLAVADFNNDGRPDLFISDHGKDAPPFPGAQSKLLNGAASNTLVDATATSVPQESYYSHYVTVGDINQDGWPDYVQAQGNCGPAVYVNDKTGKFTRDLSRVPANLTTCTVSTYAVQLVDVNNNGAPYLFVGGDPGQPGQTADILLRNDGTGRFTPAPAGAVPPRIPDASYGTVAFATADFNNDGWPDVVAIRTSDTNWTLQLMLNNGDGTFRDASNRLPAPWIPSAVGAYWLKFVQPVDINGDGYMDLLVRGNWGSSTLLLNTGQGQFVDVKDLLPTGIVNDTWFDLGPSIQAGDLNKDGKPDIIAARWNTDLVIGRNVNPLPSVAGCGYGVSVALLPVAGSGASIPVAVTAGSSCRWIASSDVSWISFGSQGVNSGGGSVNIVVAPSYSGQTRVGTVAVAGKTITITQAANACAWQLPLNSISADASGGNGTLSVTSTPADCLLAATSNAPAWLSAAVSGSTVTFTVLPNATVSPRNGTVSIGDQTFTVTQGASLGLASTTAVGVINPEPSLVGQAYAVAFAVTAPGGTPTGNVTVSDGAATNTCLVSAGTCSLTSTTAGAKTIAVSYSGDATYAVSSGSKGHNVNPPPSLSITKSHTNKFALGQNGSYTVTVSNAAGAGPSSGIVTVTEAVPAGMTLVSMSGGATWNCAVQPTCTTSTVLNAGASYPVITVAVNVAPNAPSSVTNQVIVSGANLATTSAGDVTSVAVFSPCDFQQDGSINVSDVQRIINEALGVSALAHDLNGDGVVNIADVQIEINAALGLGCAAK